MVFCLKLSKEITLFVTAEFSCKLTAYFCRFFFGHFLQCGKIHHITQHIFLLEGLCKPFFFILEFFGCFLIFCSLFFQCFVLTLQLAPLPCGSFFFLRQNT